MARVPAKVNLHLEIAGRRDDGYHEVRTLFQSVDLYDRLTAEIVAPREEFDLEVDPPGAVESGESNLVIRAALALADAFRPGVGVRFCLHKKIPVGAGLGGGSADAAAALVLLNRLWACELTEKSLHAFASALGSDVPFFLHGGLALGTGRGEEILPLPDLDDLAVVLVVPGVEVSTTEAYRRFSQRLTSEWQEGTVYAFTAGSWERPNWCDMANDLEEAVVSGWPKVGEGLSLLRSSDPLHATLSGSGAASVAIYKHADDARRAASRMPAGWFVHVGSIVPRGRARIELEWVSHGGGW